MRFWTRQGATHRVAPGVLLLQRSLRPACTHVNHPIFMISRTWPPVSLPFSRGAGRWFLLSSRTSRSAMPKCGHVHKWTRLQPRNEVQLPRCVVGR